MAGGLQDFNVSPSLFGTNWVFELNGTWLGLDIGGFGTKGLGPVLNNRETEISRKKDKTVYVLRTSTQDVF